MTAYINGKKKNHETNEFFRELIETSFQFILVLCKIY